MIVLNFATQFNILSVYHTAFCVLLICLTFIADKETLLTGDFFCGIFVNPGAFIDHCQVLIFCQSVLTINSFQLYLSQTCSNLFQVCVSTCFFLCGFWLLNHPCQCVSVCVCALLSFALSLYTWAFFFFCVCVCVGAHTGDDWGHDPAVCPLA